MISYLFLFTVSSFVPFHLSVFNDAFCFTDFTSMQEEEAHTNFEDEKGQEEEIEGSSEEVEQVKKRRRTVAADDSYACSQSDALSQQQQPPQVARPVPVQALSFPDTSDDPVQYQLMRRMSK